MTVLTITEKIYTQHCCACGMLFGVLDSFDTARRKDHGRFFCPAGHSQSYNAENEEEKLRRERNNLQQQLARAEDEKREALAAKDQEIKRIKKRSAAGACPCCNRTFGNMAEHMKKQHPKFVAEAITNVVPMKRRKKVA